MEMVFEILETLGCPAGSFQLSALVRLVFAGICGGIIGFERELKGKPAGLKTFAFVCMGATLAMVTNEYITVYVTGGSGDAARMAAQVISGIGFLGAGTIMVSGSNQIKGLTTAAALWVTASLGITVGCGFYFGAIAGTILVCTFSTLFTFFDKIIAGNNRYMRICVEVVNEEAMIGLLDFFSEKGIRVKHLHRRSEFKWHKKDICVVMELDFGKRQKHHVIMDGIRGMDGLRYVEEM